MLEALSCWCQHKASTAGADPAFGEGGVAGHDFWLQRGSEATERGEGVGGGLAPPCTVWEIFKNRGVLDANLMHFY